MLELKVHKVVLVCKVPKEIKVPKVLWDQQVPKVHKVLKEPQDL
jgi:hypothetical protein